MWSEGLSLGRPAWQVVPTPRSKQLSAAECRADETMPVIGQWRFVPSSVQYRTAEAFLAERVGDFVPRCGLTPGFEPGRSIARIPLAICGRAPSNLGGAVIRSVNRNPHVGAGT
jgi:hypothetical protein